MKKADKKSNQPADIKNPNKGTKGTNITWDKMNGNRGKQLNQNQPKSTPQKKGK